jgi:hypothetical protein
MMSSVDAGFMNEPGDQPGCLGIYKFSELIEQWGGIDIMLLVDIDTFNIAGDSSADDTDPGCCGIKPHTNL